MADSPKVALYARVSTQDQNCEMQLREMRDYLGRCGWKPAGEYVDAGLSGTKTNRPQMDRLMKDARIRRFDAVVVWKLDRWGRSLAHLVQSVQELSSLGIRFIAITQNIDTDESNPMSRLLLHLMGAFAEFERELIRDRVKAGVNNARRSGRQLGRPRTIFRRDQALAPRTEGYPGAQLRISLMSHWRRWYVGVPKSSQIERSPHVPTEADRLRAAAFRKEAFLERIGGQAGNRATICIQAMYAQRDYIKAEFKDDRSRESEWMWVRVDSDDPENKIVFGTLDNEPVVSTDLQLGMQLAVSYDIIRDHRTPTSFNPV